MSDQTVTNRPPSQDRRSGRSSGEKVPYFKPSKELTNLVNSASVPTPEDIETAIFGENYRSLEVTLGADD
jgi:hypothetical protein